METFEIKIHSEPGNANSPTIKIRFRPLDNPKCVLTLLKGMAVIKIGLVGNNITCGPNRYEFYRHCLIGQALSKFDKLAQNARVETVAHLTTVLWVIHESFPGNYPLLGKLVTSVTI